jgi:chemotaxis protein MotB
MLILGAWLLAAGCAEMDALRQRTAMQDKTIEQLRKENGEFQAAYYKIKEQLDKTQAEGTAEKSTLQLELDKAKNLRTQQEKDLADQLRTRTMEYDAFKNEAENQKALATRRVADLEQNVRTLTAERDAALSKLKETDAGLRAEQQRTNDLTQQMAAAKVDNQTKTDRIAALEKNVADLTAAQKALQAKADETGKALTKAQEDLKGAQSAADSAKTKAAAMEKDLAAARAEGEKAKSSEAEKAKLASELESVKKTAASSNLAEDAELKTVADQLKVAVTGEGVQVKHGSRGVRLIIPSDLAFDPNSVVLSAKGQGLLAAAAKVLSPLAARNIKVEGHTDNQPVKDLPFADNWGLGSARADRVRDVLMQGGVSGDHLEAVSRADKSPLGDNKTPEGRAQNRRIEIVIGAVAK